MPTLIVDMDEVIADPVTKLRAWYQRDHGKTLAEEEILGRELREAVIPEHAPCFYRYLNTPGFFRDLPLMEGARDVLEDLNQRYALFLVSAAMEFPNSLKDKYEWAMEQLPFLTWQQICLCGSKSIVQADIMIDDRAKNFSVATGRPLLYAAHHNIYVEGYERVNNWKEIAALLS